jgi:hypothetical protein
MRKTFALLLPLVLALAALPLPAAAQQSGFGTSYHRTTATKTADYTIAAADDVIPFSHASTVLTATLHTPNGYPASKQGNRHLVVNSSSTQILLVATAAGSISGPSMLYPGQSARYESNGTDTWHVFSPPPAGGQINVTLSSANILAMSATPVSLIPAPGSGKVIVVDHVSLKMVTTATQYANGGAVELRYTDASGAKVTADIAAAVITAAAATSYTSVRGVTTSLTNVANSGIFITNATAPFITGTGAGVLAIQYRVLPYA